ncbi:hypothetical protein, partial [Pseudoalteromonas sp. McH1-7]|uniref:hypothetical protein n=1 Tax=Pseudoalteromonas sp. McH1-7 TaxID=2745574 RepID=UPI001C37E130
QHSAALVGGGLPAELLGLSNKKNKTVYSVTSRAKLAPTTTSTKYCTVVGGGLPAEPLCLPNKKNKEAYMRLPLRATKRSLALIACI